MASEGVASDGRPLAMLDHVAFPDGTGDHWRVRRDACGDQAIPIRQIPSKFRISHEGFCHVYMQSPTEVAAILVSSRPAMTIKALEGRLGASVVVEQMGDEEFIVSADAGRLDSFCSAVKAVRKRRLSPANQRAFIESGRATRIKSAGDTAAFPGPESTRTAKQVEGVES